MDFDNHLVIFLSYNMLFFKHKITWGLNDHMEAAIWRLSILSSHAKLPVNRSLDRKGSLIAFISSNFFFVPTILLKEGLERSLRSQDVSLRLSIKRKAVFFQIVAEQILPALMWRRFLPS